MRFHDLLAFPVLDGDLFARTTVRPLIFLVTIVIGLSLLMWASRRRLRHGRGRASEPPVRERYHAVQQPPDAIRDVEQVMLELDQLSRQIHGRLDTKLARLEASIREADRRIEQLERLVRSADGEPVVDVTLGQQEPDESVPGPENKADDRHSVVYRLADEGLSPVEVAEKVRKTTGEVELILALRRARQPVRMENDSSTMLGSTSQT